MAVQEQTPYIEYTANGITTSFALEFDCDNQDHLIVLVDDVEPVVGAWSFSNGAVVFNAAPENGKKITIQRNTPFSRTTDYQSYNNSFRPPAVNKDFDWIWWKLQELGVADWILSNRIDALKNYVDDRDDELRAYLLEEIRKQGVALDQLEDYYNYLMQRLAEIAVNGGWEASFVVDASGKTQQEINNQLNRTVKTIADLKALQPRFNNERVFVRERHDGFGCGGGFFEYVESSTKTEDSGLFFNSVSMGKWHRIFDGAVLMSWFYSGNWDDAIDAAIASMSLNFGGGELEVPRQQDVIIQRSHQINRPILIKGTYTGAKTNLDQNENSGTLYIADGVTAFKFGIFGNVPSRMFGGGVVGVSATTLGGYTQGHVSQLYGSQNEAFGFRSITTSIAGAKNKTTGANLTNCLCEANYAFAPFKFEDNFITGLGTPFKDTAANYDVKPRNNFIRWCNVGMYMGSPGVPTTISFKDNTIERCAIGLHINYPSSLVRIEGGAIEANYAGCDVLLFNAAHTCDIRNIYFEASPNNIVICGDSDLYLSHNLNIYKSTGVHVYSRASVRNLTIENSWLKGLDLNPFAGGYIRNITLKDNWEGASTYNKFVPTADNIKLNSVAAAMADEINVIDTNNYIKNVPLIGASMDLVKPARAINKLVNTSTTANNVPTITLKVPNIFTNAVAKITILKYVGESLTQSPRYYEYLFAIRRVAGQATLYEFQELTKKSFTTMGATEVLDNAAPTVAISGAVTEEQTLVLNMVNGQTGGNSGYSLLSVDWLSSTAGLNIK